VDDLDAFSDRWFGAADDNASMLLLSVCVCVFQQTHKYVSSAMLAAPVSALLFCVPI